MAAWPWAGTCVTRFPIATLNTVAKAGSTGPTKPPSGDGFTVIRPELLPITTGSGYDLEFQRHPGANHPRDLLTSLCPHYEPSWCGSHVIKREAGD